MPEIKQNEDKNRHRGMKKYWNRSLLNDIINYYLSSLFYNSWTLSNLSLKGSHVFFQLLNVTYKSLTLGHMSH